MIKVIKSEERHHADMGWLSTHWHFSFSDYYDPSNVNWSSLRVFNDDVVQPGQGFGFHPHRDMEIVTYVLQGELEHRDNRGNAGVVHAGEVQVMSAGTGIVHSESNHSKTDPVHFLQLWVMPRAKGRAPRWEQKAFKTEDRRGVLFPVVSAEGTLGTLGIDQDVTVYVSSLRAGEVLVHGEREGRHAYLFVIAGGLRLNGTPLVAGDQARIADERALTIEATEDGELILLDLP